MNVCPTCGQALRTKADIERGKLGSLVFAERIRLGWSLRKAEEVWDIPFTTLSRVERGAMPSAMCLSKLVGILGLDASQVGDLFA